MVLPKAMALSNEAAGNKKVFVIGGGVAGLAAATALVKRNVHVELFEAGPQAGGRCRSYFDPAIGTMIDNGNHLVLSGNKAVYTYLQRIGAATALIGPDQAVVDFVDLADNARWRLRLDQGPLPFWIFSGARRVPGTRVRDYAHYAPLLWAKKKNLLIGDVVKDRGALWRRLMQPFLLAALNTAPETASAALAGAVVRESLAKGGRASRPRIAHPDLASAFITPALSFLKNNGAQVHLGARLRAFTIAGAVRALEFSDVTIPVRAKDAVILAVAPPVAQDLVPGLRVPQDFRAIVNAHFKIAPPADAPGILAVIGGTAEWIFTFPDRISVTISGADAIVDEDRQTLAARIWADVARALKIDMPMPAWQIVKEKRATFAATPEQDALRPGARTGQRNLFLAGDWTQTGLPATLEGAVRSGDRAARLVVRHLSL
jgi:squalene-associated FAD-dependent desaturase